MLEVSLHLQFRLFSTPTWYPMGLLFVRAGCRTSTMKTEKGGAMPTLDEIAEKFCKESVHDDNFVSLAVFPAQCRNDHADANSMVEIRLQQSGPMIIRTIRFSGCANLRVALDFDVLANNFPINTAGCDATSNLGHLQNLIGGQKKDMGVGYTPISNSPILKKLAALSERNLVLFKVQFCGGVIEIAARDYEMM